MADQESLETDVNQAQANEINDFLRRHAYLAFSQEHPSSGSSTGAPQCHWCYTPDFGSTGHISLDCGHVFCRQCVNACFRSGMSDRRSFPPMCCSQPINFIAVRHQLDDAVALRYTQKAAEYSVRDPTWCSHQPCSTLFNQTQIDDAKTGPNSKMITCTECRHESCVHCKQPRESHKGPKCTRCPKQAGITTKDSYLARKEGWKLCPGCSVVIERSEACAHMV